MCVPRVSYSSVVGSLACATTCVRPDIAGAVRVVSKYMAEKEEDHLTKPMEKFNSPRACSHLIVGEMGCNNSRYFLASERNKSSSGRL